MANEALDAMKAKMLKDMMKPKIPVGPIVVGAGVVSVGALAYWYYSIYGKWPWETGGGGGGGGGGSCATNANCPTGQVCVNGVCVTPGSGQLPAGGAWTEEYMCGGGKLYRKFVDLLQVPYWFEVPEEGAEVPGPTTDLAVCPRRCNPVTGDLEQKTYGSDVWTVQKPAPASGAHECPYPTDATQCGVPPDAETLFRRWNLPDGTNELRAEGAAVDCKADLNILVKDKDGNVVPNAIVILVDGPPERRTDPNGLCTFDAVGGGTYSVDVLSPVGAYQNSIGNMIELPAGEAGSSLTFEIIMQWAASQNEYGTYIATVTDSNGNPINVGEFRPIITIYDNLGNVLGTDKCDVNGRCEFPLLVGDYKAKATMSGYAPREGTPFHIYKDGVYEETLVLLPGGCNLVLYARVTHEDGYVLKGVEVKAATTQGTEKGVGVTDNAGVARIDVAMGDNPPDEPFKLILWAGTVFVETPQELVCGGTFPTDPTKYYEIVTWETQEHISVSGRVFSRDTGAGIPATVTLTDKLGNVGPYSTVCVTDGTYSFADVKRVYNQAQVEFTMKFEYAGYVSKTIDFVPTTNVTGLNVELYTTGYAAIVATEYWFCDQKDSLLYSGAVVACTHNATIAALKAAGRITEAQRVKLAITTPAFSLRVTVQDLATAAPISGATVNLYNNADNTLIGTSTTGADGRCTFSGVPACLAAVKIVASKTGYDVKTKVETVYPSWAGQTIDVTMQMAATATTYSALVSVVDNSTGAAIPYAYIADPAYAFCDANGQLTVTGLQFDRVYTFYAYRQRYGMAQATINKPAGSGAGPFGVTLRCPNYGSQEATVNFITRRASDNLPIGFITVEIRQPNLTGGWTIHTVQSNELGEFSIPAMARGRWRYYFPNIGGSAYFFDLLSATANVTLIVIA